MEALKDECDGCSVTLPDIFTLSKVSAKDNDTELTCNIVFVDGAGTVISVTDVFSLRKVSAEGTVTELTCGILFAVSVNVKFIAYTVFVTLWPH